MHDSAEQDVGVPEKDIARDLFRRSILVTPAFLLLGFLVWGTNGLISAALALGLVAFNFMTGAAIITWGLKISPVVLYGSVLGGYVLRLGVMTIVVLVVRAAGWFSAIPFAVALLTTHLGLLVLETKRVSVSLAFPGLKPAHLTSNQETHIS